MQEVGPVDMAPTIAPTILLHHPPIHADLHQGRQKDQPRLLNPQRDLRRDSGRQLQRTSRQPQAKHLKFSAC